MFKGLPRGLGLGGGDGMGVCPEVRTWGGGVGASEEMSMSNRYAWGEGGSSLTFSLPRGTAGSHQGHLSAGGKGNRCSDLCAHSPGEDRWFQAKLGTMLMLP